MASTGVSSRVQKHRAALRAAGLRPIQIWVPDVRSKAFAAKAHRQALASRGEEPPRAQRSGVH